MPIFTGRPFVLFFTSTRSKPRTQSTASHLFLMSSHNRNPGGKNQHKPVRKSLLCYAHPDFRTESILADANDPILSEALIRYHREGISSNAHIKQRLLAETGISAGCVCS